VNEFLRRSSRQLRSPLLAGALAFLSVRMLGMLASFALHVLLARLLHLESYGHYVYAGTWCMFLLLPCRLGWDTAALRFVPTYRGTNEPALLHAFVRASTRTVVVASLATGALTAATVGLLRGRLGPELALTFWMVSLLLPVEALLALWSAILRAFTRVLTVQVHTTLIRPILLAVGVLIVSSAIGSGIDASSAMAVNLASAICVVVSLSLVLRWSLPRDVLQTVGEHPSRKWQRTALPFLIMGAFQLVLARTDIVMLGMLANTSDAGVYAAASRIADLCAFGMVAVHQWTVPSIAELYAQRRHSDLQRLVVQTMRAITLLTVPIALVMLVCADPLLRLFGDRFIAGYAVLLILTGGQLANAFTGPAGSLLTMTGHQDVATWIEGTCAVLNIVLNALLIPAYGMVGAAVATAVATTTRNLWMAWLAWRRLSIKIAVR
jgi:O-antigen/teichoic acid export membrane protein